MKTIFGVIPKIGELAVTEVYDFYDEPQTFLCESVDKQQFITLLIDECEWLMVQVTTKRLFDFKKKQILFREVFTEPETKHLWRVKGKGIQLSAVAVNPKEIPDEDLPDKDVYLDIPVKYSINDFTFDNSMTILPGEELAKVVRLCKEKTPLESIAAEIEKPVGLVLYNLQTCGFTKDELVYA